MQEEDEEVSESEVDKKQNMMKTLGRLEELGLDESETLDCALLRPCYLITLTPATDVMMISREEEENQEKRRQNEEMEAILEEIRMIEDRAKQHEGAFEPVEGPSKHTEDVSILEDDTHMKSLSKKEGKRSEYEPVATQENPKEDENPEPPSYSQVAEDIDQNFEAQLEEAIKASLNEV